MSHLLLYHFKFNIIYIFQKKYDIYDHQHARSKLGTKIRNLGLHIIGEWNENNGHLLFFHLHPNDPTQHENF